MFKNAKGNSHQNHHQMVSITIVCNLKYFSNASIWQGKESAISEKTWSIKEQGHDYKIINVSTATKALFVARLESNPSVPSTFRFSFVKKSLYLQCTILSIYHSTIRKLFRAKNEQDLGISFHFFWFHFVSSHFISLSLSGGISWLSPGLDYFISSFHVDVRRHLLAQSRVRLFQFHSFLVIFVVWFAPKSSRRIWTPMPNADIKYRWRRSSY